MNNSLMGNSVEFLVSRCEFSEGLSLGEVLEFICREHLRVNDGSVPINAFCG